MTIEIKNARKEQSPDIARLIMTAMTDDCCLHFCGEGYGLEDFRGLMTMLVEREDSQYSYRNTLVVMDGDRLVGIAVSYDGGRLHELRQAFVEAAKACIGKDDAGRRTLSRLAGRAARLSPSRHCPATAESH